MQATWPARTVGPLLAGVLTAAGLAAGCGGSDAQPRVAVEPTVDLPESVALGEPIQFGYRWTPAADYSPPVDDYKVFVHLVDPQDRILLQDDHYPPEPTSQWPAGQAQEYRRWLYPPDLEVEFLDVVVGLYAQDRRAEIRDASGWVDGVTVQRLGIRVDDQTGVPVYMDGWHSAEQVDDSLLGSWRWTEQVGRVVFTNPGRSAVLHLRAHSPFDEIGGPQSVLLRVEGQEAARFSIDTADPFLRRIDLSAQVLGDKDWVEIAIEVDPVVTPREVNPDSADERKLGLQVFQLYLSSS